LIRNVLGLSPERTKMPRTRADPVVGMAVTWNRLHRRPINGENVYPELAERFGSDGLTVVRVSKTSCGTFLVTLNGPHEVEVGVFDWDRLHPLTQQGPPSTPAKQN
jgi:uncharacterized protein with NRDE domain